MSSVLPIVIGGMNAATQRFQAAAANIAAGTGDPGQAAVELMMSKVSLEAETRVAEVVAQAADRLLDITV